MSVVASGQIWEMRPVELVSLPLAIDSNSPAIWWGGEYRVFSSTGTQMISGGAGPGELEWTTEIDPGDVPTPYWIESAHVDRYGTVFVWYHYEVINACPATGLTTPKIGAAMSLDGGRRLINLGFVLDSGDALDCGAKNGYFAGGHGDFSVVPGEDGYLYFFYSNYGGDVGNQGVAVARLAYEDRLAPVGRVEKYYRDHWGERGLGGKATPIMPAAVAWQREDTDAFWGASVHWNTYLKAYVMLLNRSCCEPGWPQEGIYMSINRDLSQPDGWSQPERILYGGDWYPRVMGLGPGETDSVAGQRMRLFMRDLSEWELVFDPEPEPE